MSESNTVGPGTVLADRYKLVDIIGRGGFGTVWRARQMNMDRDVAIKVLPPEFLALNDVVERFKREAKLASRLRHPNTITLHDYGKHDNLLYIVMELLTGEDLADVLKREGRLPPERIMHIARQVLKSLAEAHEQHIVHRDLKPENIFLSVVGDDRDHVKVVDFGIAKLLQPSGSTETSTGRRLTMSGSTVGTPTYMSPEQAAGEDVDPLTDLYALGIIMYESANGRPPFHHKDPIKVMRSQLFDPVPPMRDKTLQGSLLDRVCQKALQKDPRRRFQSASEMLLAIAGDAVAKPMIRGLARAQLEQDQFEELPSTADLDEDTGPNTGDFEPNRRYESTLSFVGQVNADDDVDAVPFGIVDGHADTIAPRERATVQSGLDVPPGPITRSSSASSSNITSSIMTVIDDSEAEVILLTKKKADDSDEPPGAPLPPSPKPKTIAPKPPGLAPPARPPQQAAQGAGTWEWDPDAELANSSHPIPRKDGVGFWIVLVVIVVGIAAAAVFL